MTASVTIAPRTSLAMCRGGLQGSPKLLTAARSLVNCRNCRRSQRAALPRDLTLRWIPRRRWPEPHRRTPSRLAGSERPQPGSPPGLQFRLQFNAVRHRPAKTGQGCWSSLNRSGLSRPELLMRLGLGSHAGSHTDERPCDPLDLHGQRARFPSPALRQNPGQVCCPKSDPHLVRAIAESGRLLSPVLGDADVLGVACTLFPIIVILLRRPSQSKCLFGSV